MGIRSFIKCRKGNAAIEYGMIAALICVAIITGLTTISDGKKATYSKIASKLENKYVTLEPVSIEVAAFQPPILTSTLETKKVPGEILFLGSYNFNGSLTLAAIVNPEMM